MTSPPICGGNSGKLGTTLMVSNEDAQLRLSQLPWYYSRRRLRRSGDGLSSALHCNGGDQQSFRFGFSNSSLYLQQILTSPGSIGLSYAAHSQLCVNQLCLNGNDDQKKRFLPGLISGQKIGALAMSEHSAGSDVVSMKTTAKAVDGGFVLNGTKMWITNVCSTNPDIRLPER